MGISIVLSNIRLDAPVKGTAYVPPANGLLQEDGTSFIMQEDGTSKILQEG